MTGSRRVGWTATAAIRGGHDILAVAGRLGHSKLAMTLRVQDAASLLDGGSGDCWIGWSYAAHSVAKRTS